MKLAHFNDLKKEKFLIVTGNLYEIIRKSIIESKVSISDCYIISENSMLDAQRLPIEKVLDEIIGYGMSSIIIFGLCDVVFYKGERNDRLISIQNI